MKITRSFLNSNLFRLNKGLDSKRNSKESVQIKTAPELAIKTAQTTTSNFPGINVLSGEPTITRNNGSISYVGTDLPSPIDDVLFTNLRNITSFFFKGADRAELTGVENSSFNFGRGSDYATLLNCNAVSVALAQGNDIFYARDSVGELHTQRGVVDPNDPEQVSSNRPKLRGMKTVRVDGGRMTINTTPAPYEFSDGSKSDPVTNYLSLGTGEHTVNIGDPYNPVVVGRSRLLEGTVPGYFDNNNNFHSLGTNENGLYKELKNYYDIVGDGVLDGFATNATVKYYDPAQIQTGPLFGEGPRVFATHTFHGSLTNVEFVTRDVLASAAYLMPINNNLMSPGEASLRSSLL